MPWRPRREMPRCMRTVPATLAMDPGRLDAVWCRSLAWLSMAAMLMLMSTFGRIMRVIDYCASLCDRSASKRP